MIDRLGGSLSCLPLPPNPISPSRDSTSSLLQLLDGDQNIHLGGEDHRNIDERDGDEVDPGDDVAASRSESCFPSPFFHSWLLSLLLAKRLWPGLNSSKNGKNTRGGSCSSSKIDGGDVKRAQDFGRAILAWRIAAKRIANEVHCRGRQMMLRGHHATVAMIGNSRRKRIDFSYDERSYAKNFDMGRENWSKGDQCLSKALFCSSQECCQEQEGATKHRAVGSTISRNY